MNGPVYKLYILSPFSTNNICYHKSLSKDKEYVQKLEAKIVAQEMILKELIVSPANLLDVEEEFKEKCQIYYNKKNLEIQTETNVVETTNEQN